MVSTRSSTRSTSAAAAAAAAAATTTAAASPAPAPVPASTATAESSFTNPASNNLEIDPVSKARTITHMNKDHSADMSAILRHRAGLTEAQAADAEMLDLDLATVTIRAGGDNHKVHTVALDPPMATWNDRRSRLIDMTLDARKALGLPISAEEAQHAAASGPASSTPQGQAIQWYPPEGADLVPFSGVLFDYVSALLVFTGQIKPGTFLWNVLAQIPFLPGGPAGFAWAVTTAFPLFVGIHLLEMVWFDRTRLAPAGVKRGSQVWFLWLGGQLIDGFATFQRWDRRIVGKGGRKGEKDL